MQARGCLHQACYLPVAAKSCTHQVSGQTGGHQRKGSVLGSDQCWGGGQTVHSPKAQHANACFIHSSPSPPFFLFLCVIVCFVVVCRKRMSSQSLRQRQSWKQSSNCTGSVFPPNSCQSCCACARVRCACVCVVHPWDCEFTLSRCSLLHVHRIHAYQSWRVQTFSTAFW